MCCCNCDIVPLNKYIKNLSYIIGGIGAVLLCTGIILAYIIVPIESSGQYNYHD